jgi:hypothetical protein
VNRLLPPTSKMGGGRTFPLPLGHDGRPTHLAHGWGPPGPMLGCSPLPELSGSTEKSKIFWNHSDTSHICSYRFVALLNSICDIPASIRGTENTPLDISISLAASNLKCVTLRFVIMRT